MESNLRNSTEPGILVVDDEPHIRLFCTETLQEENHRVLGVGSVAEALRELSTGEWDIVLTDIRMPDLTGIDLLKAIRQQSPGIDVIMMTAHATVDTAVECMKLGAWDYLSKPFSPGDLVVRVDRLLEKRELSAENYGLKRWLADQRGPGGMVGTSSAMQDVYRMLLRVAPRSQPVLVLGESGTGKELVAKAVHQLGRNPSAPFVPVDCGALSPHLIESELFGHREGAFTGAVRNRKGLLEAAGHGTIFLDEIGELPLDLQSRLLRTLQEREYRTLGGNDRMQFHARIVAATNRDLAREVEAGRFRTDLYYRLNVLPVLLPPLRERQGDIAALVRHFIQRECEASGDSTVTGITREALSLLEGYHWPGNIRELQNCINRAMAIGEGPSIRPGDLPHEVNGNPPVAAVAAACPVASDLRSLEKDAIARSLIASGGNRITAARALGIGKTTIYKKIREYGLEGDCETDSDRDPVTRAAITTPHQEGLRT